MEKLIFPDYVDSLNDDRVSFHQLNFLNMMVESGHAEYCMLRALSLMYDIKPDVVETRRVLNIASAAEVRAVDYFLMLLDASIVGGEEVERAISTFTRFFKAHTLGELRRNMVGWRIPFWVRTRSFWWSRPIPDGLVLRTLFKSKDTCKGDGRLLGFYSPGPGEDYEYSQTEVCILCRFDVELHCFRRMFNFGRVFYNL